MATKPLRPNIALLLKAVPYRNERARVEWNEDGTALVTVPTRRPRWLVPPLSWILPFRDQRRIQLDGLGSDVLNMCDGRTPVERIIARLAEANKLTFREAQVPVTQFLKTLTQRGIVAIVAPKD